MYRPCGLQLLLNLRLTIVLLLHRGSTATAMTNQPPLSRCPTLSSNHISSNFQLKNAERNHEGQPNFYVEAVR